MGVGDKIKQRRQELGMTQDELAEKMGYCGKTTISKIERGERDFTQTTLLKFSQVLIPITSSISAPPTDLGTKQKKSIMFYLI